MLNILTYIYVIKSYCIDFYYYLLFYNSIINRGICSLRSHQWTPIYFMKCNTLVSSSSEEIINNNEKELLTYNSIVTLFSYTPTNQLVILSSNITSLVEWIPFDNNSEITPNNMFFLRSSSIVNENNNHNDNEILDTGSYFVLQSYENYLLNKVFLLYL